jgi:hypothetical protein
MRLPSSLAKTGEVAGLGREPRFPLPERLCAVRDEPGVPAAVRSRFRLRTGPCRALGADTSRGAELRGDLACSRLGSERKYVKRIYARDTGKARRQFAR